MNAELIAVDNNAQMLLTASQNVDAVCRALTIKSMGASVEYIQRDQNELSIFRFLRTDLPEIDTLTSLLKEVGFTDIEVFRFTAVPGQ